MNHFWQIIATPKCLSAVLLFIVGIFCLAIIVKQKLKFKIQSYFNLIIIYILLILLQLLISFFYLFQASKFSTEQVTNISAYVLILIEYPILCYLIAVNAKLKLIKRIILFSVIPFEIAAIFNWYYFEKFSERVSITTTIESIPLILFCLYFFYELLQNPPILKLSKESSFWVATGILFLFVCILPYYLAYKYFDKIYEMQLFDYAGYIIIMILFAKGSLCEKSQI